MLGLIHSFSLPQIANIYHDAVMFDFSVRERRGGGGGGKNHFPFQKL